MPTEATLPAAPTRAEIKAIPVRHPGRWVASAVWSLLSAMFVHMLFTNQSFQWALHPGQRLLAPVLNGAKAPWCSPSLSMVIGMALGILLAVMRLSPNPILSGIAWLYIWFFRAVPRVVLLILFGNLGFSPAFEFGVPFDWQLGGPVGVDLRRPALRCDASTVLSGFVAASSASRCRRPPTWPRSCARASLDPEGQPRRPALGMSRGRCRRIILPQAMRVIVPPTGNETIAMIKDTSLVAFVPYSELLFQLQAIMAWSWKNSSQYGTNATSEVSLIIAIALVAGRRDDDAYRLRQHDPPHQPAPATSPAPAPASVCPSSMEEMPARTISAMYAASDSASPSSAATNAVRMVLALHAEEPAVEAETEQVADLPVERDAELAARVEHLPGCRTGSAARQRGTARKNQTRTPRHHRDRTGFGDSLITASRMPRATPMIIDSAVSTRVSLRRRLSTGAEKALSPGLKPHWNAGFVTSMCTNMADQQQHDPSAGHPAPRVADRDRLDVRPAPGSPRGRPPSAWSPPDQDDRVDLRVVERTVVDEPAGAGSDL